MPSYTKLPSGRWRIQIRRNRKSVSRTFRLRAEAERWAIEQDARLYRGEVASSRDADGKGRLADLIDLHLTDMAAVGKPAQRSKEATLLRLKTEVGSIKLAHLTRERIIEFGRERARQGAGPATLAVDLSFISTVLQHGAAVYGYQVPSEQLRLGRAALLRLGLVGKAVERDRRPTEDELSRILLYFKMLGRWVIPMERVIKFAVASAMRQEEITRILVEDFDQAGPTVLIRQRKHPREKATNNQKVPLVADTGFDAVALINDQMQGVSPLGRIFPYNSRSIGAAFRRACIQLQISDLHFHDLRHEGISRLFEADWDIPQVAAVSGHKDWKMLQRYTHLRPSYIASRAGRLRVTGRPQG